MARPRKQGLEYFPLDIELDEKIEYIEELHGLVGFAVVIKLFQTIYRKGYFIKWGKIEKILFRKKTGLDMDMIDEIITDCLDIGLFIEELYTQHNILTSRGIQKRFYTVAKKREEVEIIDEYIVYKKLLPNKGNVSEEFPTQKPSGNSEDIPTRAGKEQHSKAKHSESKEQHKQSIADGEADPAADISIFEFLEKEFGRPIRPAEVNELLDYEKDLPKELIIEAIKRAVLNQAFKVTYVTSILHQWKMKGFKTLAEVEKEDEEYQKKKGGKAKNQKLGRNKEPTHFSTIYDERRKKAEEERLTREYSERMKKQGIGSG